MELYSVDDRHWLVKGYRRFRMTDTKTLPEDIEILTYNINLLGSTDKAKVLSRCGGQWLILSSSFPTQMFAARELQMQFLSLQAAWNGHGRAGPI